MPGALHADMRPGATMAELERIARGHSDTEYALLVQQEKARLFRSFASPACSRQGGYSVLAAHALMRIFG